MKDDTTFANMAAVSIRLNPAGAILIAVLFGCCLLYAFDVPKLLRSEQKIEMKELLSVAIDLAERGGVRVKAIRVAENDLNSQVKSKTKEGKNELKTKGDEESHKAMVNGFAKAFPDLRVHSEEHVTDPVDLRSIPEPNRNRQDISMLDALQAIPIRDITVWVDPLDATQEYTENLVKYVTTMVCIAVRGQPIIGVIHFPFSGETEWGWVGYGSSIKQPANTDKEKDRKDQGFKIIVSRSHAGDVEPVAKGAFGNKTEIIPAGGAGYKTVQVVKGLVDAYVHVTAIKKWDICAGNALLLSVGGRMTTLHGNDVSYAESGSVVNEDGILGNLRLQDHKTFLTSLEPVFNEVQKKQQKKKKKSSSLKRKRSTPSVPNKADAESTKKVTDAKTAKAS